MSCQGMSVSFNVLCYLLNMHWGRGRGVYKLPCDPRTCHSDLSPSWTRSELRAWPATSFCFLEYLESTIITARGIYHPEPREATCIIYPPTWCTSTGISSSTKRVPRSIWSTSKRTPSRASSPRVRCAFLFLLIDLLVWERVARRGESLWSSFWLLAVKSERQTASIHIEHAPGLMLCAKLMWIRASPDILTRTQIHISAGSSSHVAWLD